jgi:hypothetical protein
MRTPPLAARPDPAALHLEWLQRQYDAERASAMRDPAVMESLMKQMEATTNAMHGIATPPTRGFHPGRDGHSGTPEYKLVGAGVLAAKDDTKTANAMITDLGERFDENNKAIKLQVDTQRSSQPHQARKVLQRLTSWMAQAVPDGAHFAALMGLAIPLDLDVPASAVHDLQRGRTPPCIAAHQQLASVVGSAKGGSGSEYLATLREWRICVSELLRTEPRYSTLQKTYAKCLRNMCTNTLLEVLGAPQDALDMAVVLLRVLGHGNRENLLQAYQELLKPMVAPELGQGAQPQDLLLWSTTAFTARMDTAEVIGMDPAVLAYLAFMRGLPEGTGDMAQELSNLKANCEAFLSSDEPKNRDVILAFLAAERSRLGLRRWTGSLKNRPQSANGHAALTAYVAEATPGSTQAADDAAAGAPATPGVADPVERRVCPYWQSGAGCRHKPCKYAHPNGKSRCSKEEAVCLSWSTKPDGCNRQPCPHRHPNGKSKPDECPGDGFNKRDLTPVGGRPPVTNKAVVPEDPAATAAHARNQARRLKYAQTDSD